MPDQETRVLIRLGPFKSLDARNASVYTSPGDGSTVVNADTHRISGALSNFLGRAHYVDLSMLGPGSVINQDGLTRYDIAAGRTFYIAQAGPDGTAQTVSYDNVNQIQGSIAMPNKFTAAVQSNGNIYFNNGQQVFYGSDNALHTALWQYPAPSQASFNYAVAPIAHPLHLPGPATYTYAFAQIITLPTNGGNLQQVTSPTGAEPPYPYQAMVDGATQAVQITGTFSGTTADGYVFATQVYRMSSLDNVWNLLTTLSVNAPFIDNLADQAISAHQQILFDIDQPPTGISDPAGLGTLNPIESFQDRMWVLTRVPNSFAKGGAQTQLWYSNQGQPWAFNAVQQVQLVGSEATTIRGGGANVPFGDQVAGLAKVGSYLLAFKTLSTWIVTGVDQATYQAVPLFADIGLVAPASLTKANGRVFWLSAQAAMTYDGAQLGDITTEKLYNALQEILPIHLANGVGFFADQTWFLSFPDVPITFAYYLPTKEWTTLPYATQAAVFDTSIGSAQNAAASYKFNQIAAARTGTNTLDLWLEGQENDLGVGTQVTWTSPLTDSGEPQAQKDYQFISVSAPQQNVSVTLTLTVDPGFTGSPAAFVSPAIDLSGGPSTHTLRIGQDKCVGYTAQVTVAAATATGATSPLQIWSVQVGGVVKRNWAQAN